MFTANLRNPQNKDGVGMSVLVAGPADFFCIHIDLKGGITLRLRELTELEARDMQGADWVGSFLYPLCMFGGSRVYDLE